LGRYIFNGLTVLSLLICLATVVLWVRADHRCDILTYHSRHAEYNLIASPVGMLYWRIKDDLDSPPRGAATRSAPSKAGWSYERIFWGHMGSGFTFEQTNEGEGFEAGLPYWLIFFVTGLAPVKRVNPRLRRKRPPPGLCPKCRYDLRATPDRCPECGTVVAGAENKKD